MDLELTEEQRRLRDLAHDFAVTHLRPAVRELDAREEPTSTYPEHLVEEASRRGLRTITLSRERGGFEADCLTEVLALEELAYADPGFAMTIQHPWREGRMLERFGTEEQKARYFEDFVSDHRFVTSFAITEPHFGSDKVLPRIEGMDDVLPWMHDVETGPKTTGVRRGDEWVLNGRKVWITSGNVSRLVFAVARTDGTVPWSEGVSIFLVPRDTPGLKVGVVENKVGLRLNQNAEIIFEDCVVPAGDLLGTENGGAHIMRTVRSGSNAKEAARMLGTGRAALESARRFAGERVQGGSVLTEHQAVGHRLAEMAIHLEAARGLVWRAAWACDHDPERADTLSAMAVVFTSKAVMDIAVASFELHGSRGVRRGSDAERNLRNAAAMLHIPAGTEALLSRLHRQLMAAEA